MERAGAVKTTVCGIVILLTAAVISLADTHYVSSGQSIQAAINAATNGDQIEVAPGDYNEVINFSGKAVRLYSAGGPGVTTINGSSVPLLLKDFSDHSMAGWTIVDEGNVNGPSSWSASSGYMLQSSNIYTEPKTDPNMHGTFALWDAGMAWTDYQMTLTMLSEDDDAMGIMFRYQDANNYYRFAWLNENHNQGVGRRQLIKMHNGTFTVLAQNDTPYTKNTSYTVKIQASESNLKVFINSTQVLEANDSSFAYGSVAFFCWGNVGTHFDNIDVESQAYHVVQCTHYEGANTILEGFTIMGGNANGTVSPYSDGGGMFNDHSSPTVKNCIFTGNAAKYGGGIYDLNSSPIVVNCNFNGNTANTDGGGMFNNNSNPTVTDCTFSGNTANNGGGMYDLNSSPTVTNCVFTGNTANIYGGGMRNANSSSPTVTNCTFSGNTADYGGGMLNDNYSNPVVTNCTFSGNTADYGGGMLNETSSPTVTNCNFSYNDASQHGSGMLNETSSPTVTNSMFSGNTADYFGGGMSNFNFSSPTVTNCNFSSNMAVYDGGGIYNDNSSPTVTNCILWNDTPDEIYKSSGSPIVTYSDVMGGYIGTGNINADPCFIDAAAGDLHLRPDSPCIDAGNNAAVPGGITTDLNGLPRFIDSCRADTGSGTPPIVDIGAYEFQPPWTTHQNLLVNPGFETGDATGWVTNWGWNLTATAVQVHGGSYSGLISGRTASWQGAWQSVQGLMEDGKTYRISGWVRLQNTDSNTVYLSVKKIDLSGTHYYTIDHATAYSDRWINLDGTIVIDINGQPTELYVYFDGPAADVNFYVDDAAVTEVKGDINHNGGVDFFDFGLFALYYEFDCSTPDCALANLYDCDDTVNLLDLAILVSDWLVGVE